MKEKIEIGSWDTPCVQHSELLTHELPVVHSKLVDEVHIVRPPISEIYDPDQQKTFDRLLTKKNIVVSDFRLLSFNQATVFGSRFIKSSQGHLYNDHNLSHEHLLAYASNRGDIKPHDHKLQLNGDSWFYEQNKDTEFLPGLTMLLSSSEPNNYGAWLIRVLPKIYALRELGLLNKGRFLCHIFADWQRKLLAYTGIDLSNVVEQTLDGYYECERVIVPTWPAGPSKFLDEKSASFIRSIGLQKHNKSAPQRPVYVSRLAWNKGIDAVITRKNLPRMRPFDQEEELIKELEALGFLIFNPEGHSFEATLDVFSNASLVVGPQGSGMFNAIFCQPGTVIAEIAHLPYFFEGHYNLFYSCGMSYKIITGYDSDAGAENVHAIHRPLYIDLNKTVQFIRNLLADKPRCSE